MQPPLHLPQELGLQAFVTLCCSPHHSYLRPRPLECVSWRSQLEEYTPTSSRWAGTISHLSQKELTQTVETSYKPSKHEGERRLKDNQVSRCPQESHHTTGHSPPEQPEEGGGAQREDGAWALLEEITEPEAREMQTRRELPRKGSMRGGKEEERGERKKGVAWRGSSTHSSTPVRKASRAGGTCSQIT